VLRRPATYYLVWALLERNALEEPSTVLRRSEADSSGSGRSAWRHAARGILVARHGDDAAALEAFLACGLIDRDRGIELLRSAAVSLEQCGSRASGPPTAPPMTTG